MIFGSAFLFSCLAIMFFLHFRRVKSGEDSLIRRWVNAAGLIGPVEGWIAADTLIVNLPDGAATIRLNATDTPPLEQAGGGEALEFAKSIVAGKPVRVLEFRRTDDGVLIGEVYNSKNQSLNEELMIAGWAWYCEPDSPNNPYYKGLNEQASEKQIGLWSLGTPDPPWLVEPTKSK